MQTLFASKIRAGLVASALAVGLLAAASPAAQAQTGMTATVPFGFEGGNQHFAPGKYVVESNGFIMTLKNETTGQRQLVMTIAEEKIDRSPDSKLVFHRIGDHYFLTQIWEQGQVTGRGLAKSRTQKEVELAETRAPQTNVTLALNRIPR